MTDRIGAWVKFYGMAPRAEGMTLDGHPAEEGCSAVAVRPADLRRQP